MAHFYFDETRENEPHALPDGETFYMTAREIASLRGQCPTEQEFLESSGWYYWARSLGCLPDSDPFGPFETEEEALADAREFFGERI